MRVAAVAWGVAIAASVTAGGKAHADVPLMPLPPEGRALLAWPLERSPSLLPAHAVDVSPVRCAALHSGGNAETTYAITWCGVDTVASSVTVDALEALAEREDGTIREAAATDVANLLAERFAVDDQLSWLARTGARADTYDRLAATLIELDRPEDALRVARAVPPNHGTVASACHRAARVARLAHHDARGTAEDVTIAIRAIGRPQLDAQGCPGMGTLLAHPTSDRGVAWVRSTWPTDSRRWRDWLWTAEQATRELPRADAAAIAFAALTNARLTAGCLDDGEVVAAARELGGLLAVTDLSLPQTPALAVECGR